MATELDSELAESVRLACALLHESESAFLEAAARERAYDVLLGRRVTWLPADEYDELIATLDDPPKPMPVLERLAERMAARRTELA